MPQRLATFLFLFLTATLLIGQRFDFDWAGGEGYDYEVKVKVMEVDKVVKVDRMGMMRELVVDDLVARGEIIRTSDAARVLLDIEGLMIGLDERTDLKIEKLGDDQLQMRLIRGRIMLYKPDVQRELVITTKNARMHISKGLVSLVNYDFKETVGVMPVKTAVEVEIADKQFVTENPVEIHEVEPIDIKNTTFDPLNSAAAPFYQWFDDHIETSDAVGQVADNTPTD